MTNSNDRLVYVVRNYTIEKMTESDALYLAYGDRFHRMLDVRRRQKVVQASFCGV